MKDSLKIVLRGLALEYEQYNEGEALEDYHFDSIRIMEYLTGTGHFDDAFINVMNELESAKCIKVAVRAGEGADFTEFHLTPKGVAIGLPENSKQSRVFLDSFLKAFRYTAETLGIIGGPLALASLFSGFIDWSSPIESVIDIWQEKISLPIREMLSFPLVMLGLPKIPIWVADYLTIGILVCTSLMRSIKVQDEYSNWPKQTQKISFLKRVGSSSVFFLLTSIFWPIVFAVQVVATGLLSYMYTFRRNRMDEDVRLMYNMHMVVGRFIAFVIPVLIFFILFIVNLAFE